jgi:glycosyltransferase involved in cell wall biosynthesis
MYPPHHLGGYELMWRSAVGHLRSEGHDVDVLTTDFRSPRPDPAVADDPDVHRELRWYWRDHEFPRLPVRQRLALERHNLRVLDRHLRDLEPDVVNWWAMGGMSMSLVEHVRRLGRPAVGVVVDRWLVYGPKVDGWQRALRRAGPLGPLIGRATGAPAVSDLGRAANWLFVSETVRRGARHAGLDLPESAVVHGGIDPALFPRAPHRPWEGRLLYLGRIDSRKGIATAVRALAQLPYAVLDIVGGGDEAHERELRELARELGVLRRVEFSQKSRDELAETYAGADAVLFPVLWEEPWGLVPLEAMSVGRPVIATGTGGSGEYLRDGENCLLFKPRDDPAALAAAALRLAADEGLRNRLREGGFATAERFTEERYNRAVARALEAAAGTPAG